MTTGNRVASCVQVLPDARAAPVNALAAATFATAGSLIVSRRPGNRIGWLLCVTGLLSAGEAFAGPYARYALLTQPGALPGGTLAASINHWLWVLPLALTALFLPLLFPDGRLPSARWRPFGWFATLATALLVAVVAIGPDADPSSPEVRNPLALKKTEQFLPLASGLLAPLLVASFIGSVAAVVVRFRRSREDERRQIQQFAYAAALVLVATLIPVLLHLLGLEASDTLLIGIFQAVALPCVPIAVGVAGLKHRLYEIDVYARGCSGGCTACSTGSATIPTRCSPVSGSSWRRRSRPRPCCPPSSRRCGKRSGSPTRPS